ncbi:hypothetical protein APR41_04195 [Salegentibacter salinarum]|uniref:Uncharacterized protein n=1 Tax=Salegentibacter salinarum TaxID=447422 RepID=A0A2N0TUE4_9FLAO|nr:hypothetical protein [Salegentibacter salinarum]PKD18360.1 hypothetical protein APR41_04195 [Salegentibacter salinarum]
MKSQINIFLLLSGLILLFFPLSGYSQEKPKVFYDENGDEITQKVFYKSIDYRYNLDHTILVY